MICKNCRKTICQDEYNDFLRKLKEAKEQALHSWESMVACLTEIEAEANKPFYENLIHEGKLWHHASIKGENGVIYTVGIYKYREKFYFTLQRGLTIISANEIDFADIQKREQI